jgi:nicotinate dehydrogenase subunit B
LEYARYEEVRFDTEKVTSRYWFSRPTLRRADIHKSIEIILVNANPHPNRPGLPPCGAGETSLKPMLAAIANAIYDATSVRIRRFPFRNDRMLAALKNPMSASPVHRKIGKASASQNESFNGTEE